MVPNIDIWCYGLNKACRPIFGHKFLGSFWVDFDETLQGRSGHYIIYRLDTRNLSYDAYFWFLIFDFLCLFLRENGRGHHTNYVIRPPNLIRICPTGRTFWVNCNLGGGTSWKFFRNRLFGCFLLYRGDRYLSDAFGPMKKYCS